MMTPILGIVLAVVLTDGPNLRRCLLLVIAGAASVHLGPLVADAVYCSLPLALRGETVADRVWLVAPMNRTGSGQLNGEPLTPGNLLAFGGSAEVAGASEAPLQCGILSIAPSALERIATVLGVKSHPPGQGEFRVASVVDRGRLSRAFDLLSHTVNRHEDAALTKREAGVIERAFLEIAVRSLAGDSSRSSRYQSARLTSARIVRTCEDYARKVASLPNIRRYSASHPDAPSAIERTGPKQPQTEL